MTKCGIYMIENKVNGMRYVGQSNNITKRWTQHKCDLKAGRHDNEHLQHAFNKYGEKVFEFKILEYLPEHFLDAGEVWWINYLDTFRHGYNMTKGGESTRGLIPWNKGIRRSDRVRAILSESAKQRTGEKNSFFGKTHSEETKAKLRTYRSIPVLEVETGKIYPSAKAADIAHGGHSSNVQKALHGQVPRAYGYHWEYAKDGRQGL